MAVVVSGLRVQAAKTGIYFSQMLEPFICEIATFLAGSSRLNPV